MDIKRNILSNRTEDIMKNIRGKGDRRMENGMENGMGNEMENGMGKWRMEWRMRME